MNMSEKIIALRKKQGWSQEELAFRLEVSRQAVSKWESGSVTPEIDKIVRLSQLFNVSTDYLIKGDSQASDVDNAEIAEVKLVTKETVAEYFAVVRESCVKIAIGVLLCILSPICLLILGVLSETEGSGVTEAISVAVGLSVLFIMVAIAVAMFIISGSVLGKFEYLSKDNLLLSAELKADIKTKKDAYERTFVNATTCGVVLCILSVLPLLITAAFEPAKDISYVVCVCVLLAIVSVGVFLFIRFGMVREGYSKLLQEGEYTPDNKRIENKLQAFSSVYWTLTTAIYLGVSFLTERWDITWLVWVIAGVLYGGVRTVLAARLPKSK